MTRSLDEIADLLRDLFENEFDSGELSCFNLDSDEDIRLYENDSYSLESEESPDEINNFPVTLDIYILQLTHVDRLNIDHPLETFYVMWLDILATARERQKVRYERKSTTAKGHEFLNHPM
ncbi:hypothetical protein TNCV_4672351 [Trichonephila clavipes]|nr:hypothetical protein TNCV_4672351 [Trichonephila clavipes]